MEFTEAESNLADLCNEYDQCKCPWLLAQPEERNTDLRQTPTRISMMTSTSSKRLATRVRRYTRKRDNID